MAKLATTGIFSLTRHPARLARLNRADAETRAFLERPDHKSPRTNVLQVILATAMAVAAIKVAWILIVHA